MFYKYVKYWRLLGNRLCLRPLYSTLANNSVKFYNNIVSRHFYKAEKQFA